MHSSSNTQDVPIINHATASIQVPNGTSQCTVVRLCHVYLVICTHIHPPVCLYIYKERDRQIERAVYIHLWMLTEPIEMSAAPQAAPKLATIHLVSTLRTHDRKVLNLRFIFRNSCCAATMCHHGSMKLY